MPELKLSRAKIQKKMQKPNVISKKVLSLCHQLLKRPNDNEENYSNNSCYDAGLSGLLWLETSSCTIV
jgi:hypothetical protein